MRKFKAVRQFFLAAVVVLFAASVTNATTLVKKGFSDLAHESDRVVVGIVTAVEGTWDESGTFIRSTVTLAVERTLRGQGPGTVVLRTPGGQIDGVQQIAQGVATFEVNERVLVFLTTWEDGTPKVLGYVQGKSNVVEDEQGNFRLRGGVASGRSLENVAGELRHGPRHNVPLVPVN